MEVIDKLKSKNIKVTEVDKWGPYFRKRWEDSFAGHMSYDEKKAIYLYDDDGACGFLWHIFSYMHILVKKINVKSKPTIFFIIKNTS